MQRSVLKIIFLKVVAVNLFVSLSDRNWLLIFYND